MTRRGLLGPLMTGLLAGCSPLSALNALGPRDRGAGRTARNLSYGPDPRQMFDLYAPSRGADLPVVVFFYGGGWDSGSRALYGWAAQALASRGFLVALPDYRLSPQVHFPAFIEDAAQAVAAAARTAGDYGGDAGRLGVAGHSAGAHLALMITLDRRYMAATERPAAIRAAAGLAGPYDFLPFDVDASRNAFGRAPEPRLTQPVTFARADAPPVWLGHGTEDETVHVEDSEILHARLRALGAPAELALYPGLDHAEVIAAFSPLFRSKGPVLDDMAGFLHRALA